MRGSHGFSLLELILVLVILGLAYALVPPMYADTLSGSEMRRAAWQLAAGLRKARNHAVSGRVEGLLTLDVEERSFTISGDTHSYPLPRGLDIRLDGTLEEMLDDRRGGIRFYPDGSSTGGRVTLSHGEHGYAVHVDWLTGHVAILDAPPS